MTKAELYLGPYLIGARDHVGGMAIRGAGGDLLAVTRHEPTARLLAASWSMRELLRALEDHCQVKTTALGDQKSHAEEGRALRQRLRGLLAEIDGNVTNPQPDTV